MDIFSGVLSVSCHLTVIRIIIMLILLLLITIIKLLPMLCGRLYLFVDDHLATVYNAV